MSPSPVPAVLPSSKSRRPSEEAEDWDVAAVLPAADGDAPDVIKESRATSHAANQVGEEEEEGAVSTGDSSDAEEAPPPLANEATPDGPPLPNEPVPEGQDDGWDYQWEPNAQTWFFHNCFTGMSQWENPRIPAATATGATSASSQAPAAPANTKPAAGGYNPAIHGDYDPNAWYAQAFDREKEEQEAAEAAAAAASMAVVNPSIMYATTSGFNRFTGQFQAAGAGPNRHSDEAKARRQMNAFFDVDAAANAHDGRSLKAERQNQKLSKSELKAYKEKRRAKKEEKRRAWLMD